MTRTVEPSNGPGTAASSVPGSVRPEGRLAGDDGARFPSPVMRVDAVGLLCPIPITRTARSMRDLRAGDVLELRADDRVVLIDLPNWCRSWRHQYLGHVERDGVLHLFVRKQGSAP